MSNNSVGWRGAYYLSSPERGGRGLVREERAERGANRGFTANRQMQEPMREHMFHL